MRIDAITLGKLDYLRIGSNTTKSEIIRQLINEKYKEIEVDGRYLQEIADYKGLDS